MTARMRDGAKDGDKSFSKLFDIIEEIAASRSGLRGREVAERTGMPVSTTIRMGPVCRTVAQHRRRGRPPPARSPGSVSRAAEP